MFLNPWLLLGACGIAVPILIHLLNQRRFQRVVWAAMRFVQLSIEKNRQRMRTENLLLLLLRCLILVLLALALARPVLSSKAAGLTGRQPVTAVLILDHSASMNHVDGTQTRFAAAKNAADDIVAGLPTGSSVALLLISDATLDVIPQPTLDLTLVRQNLARARPTDRGTNLGAALKRAFTILSSLRAANKQLFIITDGQAAGWRRDDTPAIAPDITELLDANQETVQTHLCLISDHDARNLLVSDLRLTTELPTADKPLRFEADVTNAGRIDAHDVTLRLFTDSAATPSDEATLPLLPARTTRRVSLGARITGDGYHVVTVQLPRDHLPADDQRSLVLRMLADVRVLLVNGAGGLGGGRQAQEEDEFFIRNALEPVPLEQRPTYFLQTDTIDASELERTNLEKYDAIVLANVPELSQSTLATLERVIAQGRGLLVFSGPRVNIDFYRDVLYRQHGLLPAWLSDPRGEATGDRFDSLQTGNFDHPISSPWNQKGQGDPSTARFFRMNDLLTDTRPATPTGDGAAGPVSIIARYATGKVAIAEHAYDQGRVILVGTTANTAWTDFPARGTLFVPFMQRTLDRLLHRQEESLNVMVGQRLKLRVPTVDWGKDVTITPPLDLQLPIDRARIDMIDNWPTLAYNHTDRSGIYRINITGAPPGAPNWFSVQPNAAESDLQELTPGELATLSARLAIADASAGTSLKDLSTRDGGLELWRPVIMVGLLLILLELIFAFRYSRTK